MGAMRTPPGMKRAPGSGLQVREQNQISGTEAPSPELKSPETIYRAGFRLRAGARL
jgi:hypothetical protein